MRLLSVIISFLILSFLGFCSLIHAQQLYEAKTSKNCSNTSNSVFGYSCNGLNRSCQAYLTFRSQPPYNTVSSISTLLSSDPSQLSAINSVSETASFHTNELVIVPANCSCSGYYYQANTSYVVQPGDTPFKIANNIYQGLATCQAFNDQNRRSTAYIFVGQRFHIPLRCACPTKNQADAGIKYLLSYLVTWGDSVSAISKKFGAEFGRTLEANMLNKQSVIYPVTTLLIPLQNPPSSSQTMVPPPASPRPPLTPPSLSFNIRRPWVYVIVGVLGGIFLTLAIGIIIFFAFFHETTKRPGPVIVSESLGADEKPLKKKLVGKELEELC